MENSKLFLLFIFEGFPYRKIFFVKHVHDCWISIPEFDNFDLVERRWGEAITRCSWLILDRREGTIKKHEKWITWVWEYPNCQPSQENLAAAPQLYHCNQYSSGRVWCTPAELPAGNQIFYFQIDSTHVNSHQNLQTGWGTDFCKFLEQKGWLKTTF